MAASTALSWACYLVHWVLVQLLSVLQVNRQEVHCYRALIVYNLLLAWCFPLPWEQFLLQISFQIPGSSDGLNPNPGSSLGWPPLKYLLRTPYLVPCHRYQLQHLKVSPLSSACVVLHQVLCLHAMASSSMFVWGSWVCKWVGSLVPVPSLGLLSFCWSVLSNFYVIFLFYIIIFYFLC